MGSAYLAISHIGTWLMELNLITCRPTQWNGVIGNYFSCGRVFLSNYWLRVKGRA
jgi:hypothetical protein